MSFRNYFHSRGRSKKGFTLVEMVLAVGIMAIVSGATLYLVFAVQQAASDAGTITSEQYTGTQIERFLRNELQTGMGLEKKAYADLNTAAGDNDNAEYIYFDHTTQQLVFMKAETAGDAYETYFSVDSVSEVNLTFKTMEASSSAAYVKLEYEIVTELYTYSGGIIIGNIDSQNYLGGYDPVADAADGDIDGIIETFEWKIDDDGNPVGADNGSSSSDFGNCLKFYSIQSTLSSSSTP